MSLALLLAAASAGAAGIDDRTPSSDDAAPRSPELDENAGLRDYLDYAAAHSPQLASSFSQWQAALAMIPQAKSLPDPRLTYGYFVTPVETRVGPQRHRIGVAQPLPWFGKLGLRGDAAARAADAQFQLYEKARLDLFRRVKTGFYEYFYLAQALAVTREHMELVVNLEAVARTRFKAGSAAYSAPIQAQVELGKLTDRLRTLEEMRAPIVAALNADLNRPPGAPLPWPEELPDFQTSFTAEEAARWLRESNPDLLRLAHLEDKEELGLRLARKDFYPDVVLGLEYIETGEAMNPGMAGSGDDPVIATASVSLPLWFGRLRAAEREARLRRDAVRDRRQETLNRLQADLEMALYRYRDSERKLRLYADTLIPKADEFVNVAQQGFEVGNVAFISLIDAERMLLEFQLTRERARADRLIHLAEIEILVNRDFFAGQRIPAAEDPPAAEENREGGHGDQER